MARSESLDQNVCGSVLVRDWFLSISRCQENPSTNLHPTRVPSPTTIHDVRLVLSLFRLSDSRKQSYMCRVLLTDSCFPVGVGRLSVMREPS